MTLKSIVIFLTAGFFIFYGLAFALLPVSMSTWVTGTGVEGVSAIIDFRATYGGMTIGIGLTIFLLYKYAQTDLSLIIVMVVLLAMASGRTLGLLIDGSGNTLMYLFLVGELVGSVLAWIALTNK